MTKITFHVQGQRQRKLVGKVLEKLFREHQEIALNPVVTVVDSTGEVPGAVYLQTDNDLHERYIPYLRGFVDGIASLDLKVLDSIFSKALRECEDKVITLTHL